MRVAFVRLVVARTRLAALLVHNREKRYIAATAFVSITVLLLLLLLLRFNTHLPQATEFKSPICCCLAVTFSLRLHGNDYSPDQIGNRSVSNQCGIHLPHQKYNTRYLWHSVKGIINKRCCV